MKKKQYAYIKKHTTLSDATIRVYLAIISRLVRYANKPSCQDVTPRDLREFVAGLPGSMKPQAFAAIRLVYGKMLFSRLSEEMQKEVEWFVRNTPKQPRRKVKADIHYAEILKKTENMSVDMALLCRLLLYGMRLTEAITLEPKDVKKHIIQLRNRQWLMPACIQEELLFWRDVAKRKQDRLFPKSGQTYALRLKKHGLTALQIRRAGIERAFERHEDPYCVWPRFGITSLERQAFYWGLYG